MVSKIQQGSFSGIICVSGDGLVHEVINGIMKRDDWEECIKIPIGTIPAGSGNALATELNILDPISAAFSIAKGTVRPLDLLQVRQEHVPDTYSFLSVNWGIVSDVDFESEKYRFMGGARFTVGALVRVANLKYYKAKLEYIPAESVEGARQFCLTTKQCNACKAFRDRKAEADDFSGEEKIEVTKEFDEEEEHWETIDGEFVTIVGCNISKLSSDVNAAPYAHLSDGAIDLLIVTKSCTKTEMLNLFTLMETGEFVNHPIFNSSDIIRYLKVKRYKLTPIGKNSSPFGFDGEHAKSQKAVDVTNRWGLANIIG